MTRASACKLLVHAICGVIAAVYLYAGITKMGNPHAFADSIAGFRLLPLPWMITLLALGLPFFEVLVAVSLLVPSFRRPGLLAVGMLSVVFIGALASAWARGIVADCGCFGEGQATAWSLPLAILRNVLILLTSMGALLLKPK